ncbi:MAG: hypothetical protein JRI46_10560 [Deltaproteobacteria bacterium]|nr:hypothetical protein [Deltaproteobacteria bacterium]
MKMVFLDKDITEKLVFLRVINQKAKEEVYIISWRNLLHREFGIKSIGKGIRLYYLLSRNDCHFLTARAIVEREIGIV